MHPVGEKTREWSRRRFLRLLALGLGAASSTSIFACVSSTPTAAPTALPAQPNQAPKPPAPPVQPAVPSPIAASTAPSASPKPAADWQTEWDRILAAARREGRVVVYGPPGDIIRKKFTEAFPLAYPGIELEWNGGPTSPNASKLEAERRGGLFTADVFLGGSTTANAQLRPIGAADPILPALILPEVKDPKNWRDDRLDFSDTDQAYNLTFVNLPLTMAAYNTDLVKESELQDPENLLDPKWKGKIVIADPVPTGPSNTTHRFLWRVLGADQGTRFVRALREQAPAQGGVERDARRMLEALARGRFSIAVGASDGALSQLEEQGITNLGKVRAFRTHGGVVGTSFGSVTRMNRPPHPNAQIVFMNWLLSRDGQIAYSTALDQPSLRKDVPTDHLPADARLQSGVQYWRSYHESEAEMPPQLAELLQNLYGRASP